MSCCEDEEEDGREERKGELVMHFCLLAVG